MLVPLRIIPAKSVFAHLQFTRLWYFRTNASNHCRFAFPFFDSSLCDEFLTHVHIQPFVQLIQIRRFTVLHSLCWLTPSTFIPPSFRLSMCSRLSASPSWVRLCRIAFSVFGFSELGSAMPNRLFGLRLLRAGFGYAESSFRSSACPSWVRLCRIAFRSSACPSWVRLCRIAFWVFGLSVIPLLSASGFHAPTQNTAISIIKSAIQSNSIPSTCFYGVSLVLVRSKEKYKFGQSALFCIYDFISDFSKMLGIWKKDIKNRMRKRI